MDRLVEAFDRLRGRGHAASLAIVGDGPYRKDLQARCQDRAIAFTDVLEGDELATEYSIVSGPWRMAIPPAWMSPPSALPTPASHRA